MNEDQALDTLRVLGSNWDNLRSLDEHGIELWYRTALRDTAAAGNGTDEKPDALEVVERLVATMTYTPRPADWIRVLGELKNERRRAKQLTNTNVLEEPTMTKEDRLANLAKLRDLLHSIPKRDAL